MDQLARTAERKSIVPICHLATFTFKPATSAATIADFASALDALAAHTPALAYHHGHDLGLRDGNANYAVSAVFRDQDDLVAYLNSPEHLDVADRFLTPHLESKSTVQIDVRSFGGPPSPTA